MASRTHQSKRCDSCGDFLDSDFCRTNCQSEPSSLQKRNSEGGPLRPTRKAAAVGREKVKALVSPRKKDDKAKKATIKKETATKKESAAKTQRAAKTTSPTKAKSKRKEEKSTKKKKPSAKKAKVVKNQEIDKMIDEILSQQNVPSPSKKKPSSSKTKPKAKRASPEKAAAKTKTPSRKKKVSPKKRASPKKAATQLSQKEMNSQKKDALLKRRGKITRGTTSQELNDYYYANELADYLREQNLPVPSGGKKKSCIQSIITFHTRGRDALKKKKRKHKPFDPFRPAGKKK